MSELGCLAMRGKRCAQFLVLGFLFLTSAAPARAATLTVNCPAGPGFATIQAAVDASSPGDSIVVTGTCPETVSIGDKLDLTIQASAPGSATVAPAAGADGFDIGRSKGISLISLIIDGGNAASTGIAVFDNSNATVTSCTIQKNVDVGVSLSDFSRALIAASTIQGNTGDGVDLSNFARAMIRNTTIINNGAEGVNALNHALVAFQGSSQVANNGDAGVFVIDLSKAVFQANGTVFTTVEGNATAGILVARQALVVLNPGTRVRNNGSACPSDPTCGGIFGLRNSTVRLISADVSSNLSSGIAVQQDVDLAISNSTITNNAGDGVHVQRISIADFIGGGNTFAGNGGASIFCDSTSLAVGDLTGVSNVSCKQIERPTGPPRPGRVLGTTP